MSAGDNTRDDRWRPGFASSERRVREELEDAREPVIQSRELSFVPAQSGPKFEAHDAQTQALIAEYKRLEALAHGPRSRSGWTSGSGSTRCSTPRRSRRISSR
jgi:hypothetical protein